MPTWFLFSCVKFNNLIFLLSPRSPEKSENVEDPSRPGVIDLKKFGGTIVRRHADLVLKSEQKPHNASSQTKNVKKAKREYQSPLVSMRNFLAANFRIEIVACYVFENLLITF